MTKQEEMREGIASLLRPWMGDPEGSSDDILNYLHSQGVVIKVDGISDDLAQTPAESPKYFARGKDMALVSTERTSHIYEGFRDMGYVAVEPLIKDEKL